jgi:hypothetical protein
MNHLRVALLTLTLGVCPSFAADKPKEQPKPKPKPEQVKTEAPAREATAFKPGPVIPQAIAALTREYQAYLKDPKANTIRDKPDFFTISPSPEATPENIMRGLEQSVSSNKEIEAYVKWQLLSGIPARFPTDLEKRALAVYKRAPHPLAHPGLNRRALDKAGGGADKEEIASINKQLNQAVKDVNEGNKPILAYRNELYSRLTVNYDVIRAGLDDVADRASSGVNATNFFSTIAAGIRSWALIGAKPGQINNIGSMIADLKASFGHDDNRVYTKLKDDKKWEAANALDARKLDELTKFLEQTASRGGLKFKDDK